MERKARYNPLVEVYRGVSLDTPPKYIFSSNLPDIYSLELDIILLTAQYTAVNGKKVVWIELLKIENNM